MWPDVLDLRNWYQTLLGKIVRRTLRKEVRNMFPTEEKQATVLGIGYCQPYLPLPQGKRQVVLAMPAAMGGLGWPEGKKNTATLCHTEALPFVENTFDTIFISHALEFTHNPEALLTACWHALRPDGRLIVVAPNRAGVWARREESPFSQGRPYSINQLHKVLRQQNFHVLETKCALFFPPLNMRLFLKFHDFFERWGARMRAPLGGVVVAHARKDIFGMRVVRGKNLKIAPLVHIPAVSKFKGVKNKVITKP